MLKNSEPFEQDPTEGLPKPPINPSELELFNLLTKDGWQVTKKGWPDFACFRNDELVLVEVKPKRSHYLKKTQFRLMMALARRGITCLRWTPDGGFQPVEPSAPSIEMIGVKAKDSVPYREKLAKHIQSLVDTPIINK